MCAFILILGVVQIAYNWVTGDWYFADNYHDMIFMCTKSGRCLTLVSLDLQELSCIVLDPNERYGIEVALYIYVYFILTWYTVIL